MINSFQTLMPITDAPSLHAKCDKPSVVGFNFKMEVWVKTIESDCYEVSNLGRFRSLKSLKRNKEPHILKLHISKTGYWCVGMFLNGKTIDKKCHRLLAQAFIPNPENKPQINHIDGNKLNNSLDNLEWVSNKQNSDHAWKNNLISKRLGEETSGAILKEADVINIYSSNESTNILATKYGVHLSSINAIQNGKCWGWLTGHKYKKREVDAQKILSIYNEVGSDKEIAVKYCVDRRYVNSIKNGYKYSNITGAKYERKNKPAIKKTKELEDAIIAHTGSVVEISLDFNVSESFIRNIKRNRK